MSRTIFRDQKIIDEREKVQGKGPLECPSIDDNPILKGQPKNGNE